MKIAFIVSGFPSISQTFILNQITGLLDLGHHVEIFANYNPKPKKIHPDIEKYNLIKSTHYLPDNKIKLILNSVYFLFINFHRSPLKVLKSLNIFKYRNVGLSLKLLNILCHFLHKDFEIIHCHFGPNGILGVWLKETGVKSIVISAFYGYDLSSFILSNGNEVYRDLFNKGDLFLSISDYFKRKLVQLGCDEKKIIVQRLGIDLEKFRFSENKFQFSNTVKILSIGRLIEKKGFEFAIKALARVISKYNDLIYLIAGDGPLKNKLETLVSELGIYKNVKFLGPVRQDEVIRLYKQANIFILPSITAVDGDQEGTPVVLLECQAMGLPVISTYHSGIPEVIIDGKSGFLVPERDVDSLANKLEFLIVHPELWPEMGRCGRKLVEERYDIRKLNQRLEKIFAALLSDDSKLLKDLGSYQ